MRLLWAMAPAMPLGDQVAFASLGFALALALAACLRGRPSMVASCLGLGGVWLAVFALGVGGAADRCGVLAFLLGAVGGTQRRQLWGRLFLFKSFHCSALPGGRRLDFRLAGGLLFLLVRPVPGLLAAAANVAVFRRPRQITGQAAILRAGRSTPAACSAAPACVPGPPTNASGSPPRARRSDRRHQSQEPQAQQRPRQFALRRLGRTAQHPAFFQRLFERPVENLHPPTHLVQHARTLLGQRLFCPTRSSPDTSSSCRRDARSDAAPPAVRSEFRSGHK